MIGTVVVEYLFPSIVFVSCHINSLHKSDGEDEGDTSASLTYRINQLKRQIQADRVLSDKHEENKRKLENHVSELFLLATSRSDTMRNSGTGKMLSLRISNPLCEVGGFLQGSGDRDYANGEEVVSSTTAKLPLIENIPPYTTWIFLDKNQRMAEDQSVVGRRRIYYDQHGSEALICSDSEEDIAEPEEEKRRFSEGEEKILWMASQEFGLNEEVLDILTQYVGGTTFEILEHCNVLGEKHQDADSKSLKDSGESVFGGSKFLDKSLTAALDSFDNLFCRRCLVFDCRLHGCSQILIDVNERQSYSSDLEDDDTPCSDQCYLKVKDAANQINYSTVDLPEGSQKHTSEVGGSTVVTKRTGDPDEHIDEKMKHAVSESMNATLKKSDLILDYQQDSSCKRRKLSLPTAVAMAAEDGSEINELSIITHDYVSHSQAPDQSGFNHGGDSVRSEGEDTKKETVKHTSYSKNLPEWKPLEKELYSKGIEIFGRNSCLIARNLLPGLKTCMEVSSYMDSRAAAQRGGSTSLFSEDNGKADMDYMEPDIPTKSRFLRRRGRTRKLKYSSKSAGHPSIWRRMADGKNQSCILYNPCGCQPMCGKNCPCLQNGTCCEKYCGCSKSCKNRFRGCHCAKSQCRSRQCPCFAAGRECDPDVCRNCWVSCGDGSLGEPPRQGEGQCGNMRLLLRQQQRILLGKSDVAGWGAFLKNPVYKNDYLGEYTGELISHREADKRGKIYDRANSSFLFDLNDQYVLDAYRKGDKLKFANHSSNPNCYAKVMLVAGDHRVGIFAKERIEASEELFYDYRYGPDQAPIWARKPEGTKRDDSPAPQGRPKKHQ
ncbi:histone-lysine N-methyltransferase EZA1 isoform X2 [Lycium ferocissimum]|uniref:histone-lysine N-methyltransferase EZA1 isoform X2 n=1 Tax=Lycium ferocissimum TaxID=112874 RepID=UPI002815E721|nr:histone-lysine N-methyltransferase EZA1 isoform X2 [Lycium ferocissimum]